MTGEDGNCSGGVQPSTGDPRGMNPWIQEQMGLPALLTTHWVLGPQGEGWQEEPGSWRFLLYRDDLTAYESAAHWASINWGDEETCNKVCLRNYMQRKLKYTLADDHIFRCFVYFRNILTTARCEERMMHGTTDHILVTVFQQMSVVTDELSSVWVWWWAGGAQAGDDTDHNTGCGTGEWVAAAVDHQTYKDLHSLVSIYCYNDMIVRW